MPLQKCISSIGPILSNLKSFISGTADVIFLNLFFARTSPPRRRLFWARPFKTVLAALLAAFLKKRMATLITTEKPLQVLKVMQIYIFFSVVLTVRLCFCVAELVREISVFQRLRGKDEW